MYDKPAIDPFSSGYKPPAGAFSLPDAGFWRLNERQDPASTSTPASQDRIESWGVPDCNLKKKK
jgi:hypothetical protein